MTEWERAPFVSVIIPTYNRCASLRVTVDSFLAQSYPPSRFEIILVDNASTDDTRKVISELAHSERNVRGMSEPRRGAHFARNSGAMVALGEIFYFTDDDMVADPRLLETIVTAFSPGSNVGSATGRVLPTWESEPPQWVLNFCSNAILSLNDQGEGTIVSDDDPGVFSCHQAILREAFMEAGGFNPDTNAETFTGDNETGLNIKVRNLGYRFAYVGHSVTHHLIPASRMTQRYLNGRLADQGFCDSYTAYRTRKISKGRLVTTIGAHALLAGARAVQAVAGRAIDDSRWRLYLARFFYHRNRARYDTRLLTHSQWRRFAMRSDWLGDDLGPDGVVRIASGPRPAH